MTGCAMSKRFRLAEAMNTYTPALLVLRQWGYAVTYRPPDEPGGWSEWSARKEDREFIATDPLTLLGLATIGEVRGKDWQRRSGEPDMYGELLAAAFPVDPPEQPRSEQ